MCTERKILKPTKIARNQSVNNNPNEGQKRPVNHVEYNVINFHSIFYRLFYFTTILSTFTHIHTTRFFSLHVSPNVPKDLDHLAELQLPLQTDALKRISANVTSPPANVSAELRDTAANGIAAANSQEAERLAEAMQPAFNYYPGFSFLRDLDAKNGVADNNKDETTEVKGSEDEDEESSSDEYDDEDAYDGDGWDDEALLENFEANKNASPSAVVNLNSLLNVEAKTLDSANGRGGAAALGGLRQMLAKHQQNESDSSDG